MPYDPVYAAGNILKYESHRFFSEFTAGIHTYGAKVSWSCWPLPITATAIRGT